MNLDILSVSPIASRNTFSNLSTLALESCFDLRATLTRLVASGHSVLNFTDGPRLKTFYLRQEMADNALMTILRTFLVSFQGLEHLHVLLEGSSDPPEWGPVFDEHGPTLKTLVWDHRKKSRSLPRTDVDMQGKNFIFLANICCKCPQLIGLGLTLDWALFTSNSDHRDVVRPLHSNVYAHSKALQVRSFLSHIEKLETLNIRNMPEVQTLPSWPTVEQVRHSRFLLLLQSHNDEFHGTALTTQVFSFPLMSFMNISTILIVTCDMQC